MKPWCRKGGNVQCKGKLIQSTRMNLWTCLRKEPFSTKWVLQVEIRFWWRFKWNESQVSCKGVWTTSWGGVWRAICSNYEMENCSFNGYINITYQEGHCSFKCQDSISYQGFEKNAHVSGRRRVRPRTRNKGMQALKSSIPYTLSTSCMIG